MRTLQVITTVINNKAKLKLKLELKSDVLYNKIVYTEERCSLIENANYSIN